MISALYALLVIAHGEVAEFELEKPPVFRPSKNDAIACQPQHD